MTPTLMAESEEELKRLLMKVKEESEKVGLILNIQKTKIKSSGPITSWQIDGGNNGNCERLYFGGSKITADGDCSHEIKRYMLLERKPMINLVAAQLLSCVQLFVTPWTKALQASLSFTIFHSLLKLMSIELVMPSTISSSVVPFFSCLQSFPASGSFLKSWVFA